MMTPAMLAGLIIWGIATVALSLIWREIKKSR